MTVPPDPFADAAVPAPRPGEPEPVAAMLKQAIDAAVKSQRAFPALAALGQLTERGPGAVREACLILIEHTLSGGQLGTGPHAADRYMVRIGQPLDDLPAGEAVLHRATAAYIDRGPDAARGRLALAAADAAADALRYLMCVVLAGKMTSDAFGEIAGQLYADAL